MNRLRRQIIAALSSQLVGGSQRPPEGGAILWNTFNRLSQVRTWHAHGPNPIQPSEVEAYCRLMRLPLEPRHIEVIFAMDRVWLDHVLVTMKRAAGKPAMDRVSPAPLTAELLDAILG